MSIASVGSEGELEKGQLRLTINSAVSMMNAENFDNQNNYNEHYDDRASKSSKSESSNPKFSGRGDIQKRRKNTNSTSSNTLSRNQKGELNPIVLSMSNISEIIELKENQCYRFDESNNFKLSYNGARVGSMQRNPNAAVKLNCAAAHFVYLEVSENYDADEFGRIYVKSNSRHVETSVRDICSNTENSTNNMNGSKSSYRRTVQLHDGDVIEFDGVNEYKMVIPAEVAQEKKDEKKGSPSSVSGNFANNTEASRRKRKSASMDLMCDDDGQYQGQDRKFSSASNSHRKQSTLSNKKPPLSPTTNGNNLLNADGTRKRSSFPVTPTHPVTKEDENIEDNSNSEENSNCQQGGSSSSSFSFKKHKNSILTVLGSNESNPNSQNITTDARALTDAIFHTQKLVLYFP